MNRAIYFIITLVVGLVIAYGVYDFLENHEYKETKKHTGFHGEARNNPLYASRLFLKRMGISTLTKTSLQGLGNYPATDTIIVLNTKRSTLSPEKVAQLIEWVESGGHLIAKATKDWEPSEEEEETKESRDPLQKHLGVHVGSGNSIDDLDETIDDLENFLGEDLELNDKEADYPTVSLKGTNKELALKDRWFRTISVDKEKSDITEEVELNGDNYIIRQKLGNGLVTLVSDMRFIENKGLDIADHAEILWHLIHGLHPSLYQPTAVWLIHNDEMPPLWKILWKVAWALIISLILLLLAWLLSSTRRFGPLIPKAEENRRSLTEHITSSGNYYWKNNGKDRLIESSREALMKRLSRVHPGWSQRTEQEQTKIIAEQTQIPPETIHRVLFLDNIKTAEEFTETIRQIENIRKSV